MKRVAIKYRSAVIKKRETDAKKLAGFLNDLRANGHSDEEVAIKLGSSNHTIRSWRLMRRFPKRVIISGIEKEYGVKIL